MTQEACEEFLKQNEGMWFFSKEVAEKLNERKETIRNNLRNLYNNDRKHGINEIEKEWVTWDMVISHSIKKDFVQSVTGLRYRYNGE